MNTSTSGARKGEYRWDGRLLLEPQFLYRHSKYASGGMPTAHCAELAVDNRGVVPLERPPPCIP